MAQDTPVHAVLSEVENGNYTAAIRSKNALSRTLQGGAGNERECAARALALLSFEYPDEAYGALDAAIEAATTAERESVRGNAMSILAALARAYPDEVARYAKPITEGLSDSHETVVINAVEALAFITRSAPQGALDVLDEIEQLLDSRDSDVRRYAAIVLYNIAEEYPNHVVEYDIQLISLLSTENNKITRIAASGAIYYIADQNPTRLTPRLDDLDSLLRAETDIRVRGSIVGIFAKISEERPQEVRPYLSVLERHLSVSNHNTLVNTTNAISHIAESDPEAVSESGVIPEIRSLWDRTDSQAIRTNISHITREVTRETGDHSAVHNHHRESDLPPGMIRDAKRLVDESARQVVLEVDNFFTDITRGDETSVEVIDSALGHLGVNNENDRD